MTFATGLPNRGWTPRQALPNSFAAKIKIKIEIDKLTKVVRDAGIRLN
ncbi:MAG: hypothetical protein ACXWCY_30840 [Burkholderiales bacterium]